MKAIPRLLWSAALACCACAPALAGAGSFRNTIKIVVPQAPGGGTDLVARVVAPVLSKELGQNVIIENRPGASGQVGTQLVQNAAPDGSTILCAVDHSLVIVPLTTPSARYNVETDFVALGQGARTYWTLLAPNKAPYQDFSGYLQAVKGDPLLRSYGVALVGGATGAIGDAIGKAAGVAMTPVPYAGSALVLQNVMAGQLPAGLTGMAEAVSAHRSGKARVLAVTGAQRTSMLPDIPTFKELGIPNLEFHTFVGFFGPRGFAPAMAREFNAALRKALNDPEVQEKIQGASMQPAPTTLEEANREVADIAHFWKASIRTGDTVR